jgi:hypothetical protein
VAKGERSCAPYAATERDGLLGKGAVGAERSDARHLVICQRRHLLGEVVLAVATQHPGQTLTPNSDLTHSPTISCGVCCLSFVAARALSI